VRARLEDMIDQVLLQLSPFSPPFKFLEIITAALRYCMKESYFDLYEKCSSILQGNVLKRFQQIESFLY
jgi:hypothetical protein